MTDQDDKLSVLVKKLSEFSSQVDTIKIEIDNRKEEEEKTLKQKNKNNSLKDNIEILKERLKLIDEHNDLEAQLYEKHLSNQRRLNRIKDKYEDLSGHTVNPPNKHPKKIIINEHKEHKEHKEPLNITKEPKEKREEKDGNSLHSQLLGAITQRRSSING